MQLCLLIARLSPRLFLSAGVAILLAGFALRVWSLGDDSLWSDEAYTVFFAEAPASRFVELLLVDGVHVPLYFALMRLCPTGNDFVLRMPSVLLGWAAIALLIFVVKRLYSDRRLALWAGALLAVNPFHIWHSRMARPYALFFVLALLASYPFLALLDGRRTRVMWAGFLLSSAAAYLTHYFAVALALAQYAVFAFALRGNRRFFRQWVGAQVLAFFPLAVWIYRLATQESVSFGTAWIPKPVPWDPPLTLADLGVGYEGTSIGFFALALAALAVGLVCGAATAWRQRWSDHADLYWLWLIVLALVPVFSLSLIRPIYADRYFMVMLPAILLLMLRGWQRLPRHVWRAALAGLVVVSEAGYVVLTINGGDNERQDWRAAADTVELEYQSGDAFVMDASLSLLPFLRYFEDEAVVRARLVELNGAIPPDALRAWVICPDLRVDVHRQSAAPSRFDPLTAASSPLGDWLIDHQAQIVDQRAFNGLTVFLVDMGGEFPAGGEQPEELSP